MPLDPQTLASATNKAHALMFLGRAGEGFGLWDEEVLKDFAEFEKRGLKHARMAEIRALLTAKEAGR